MPRTGSPLLKYVVAARTRAAALNAVGNINLAIASTLPRKYEKAIYEHETMLQRWLDPALHQSMISTVASVHSAMYGSGSSHPAVEWYLICRVEPLDWRFVPIMSVKEKTFVSPGKRAHQHTCYALETEGGDLLLRGETFLVSDPEKVDRVLRIAKQGGVMRDAGWFARKATEVATDTLKPVPVHVDAIARDRLEPPVIGRFKLRERRVQA